MALKFLQRIFQRRRKPTPLALREILQVTEAAKQAAMRRRRRRTPFKYVKAITNGHYVRIKVPPKHRTNIKSEPEPLEKPSIAPASPLQSQATTTNIVTQTTPTFKGDLRRFLGWLKSNIPVLTLNVGSMLILFGFGRSDLLELRAMTMTGQITFAVYNLAQATILWPSVAWSTLFASVNAYKIMDIFHERNAEVHMTKEQGLKKLLR